MEGAQAGPITSDDVFILSAPGAEQGVPILQQGQYSQGLWTGTGSTVAVLDSVYGAGCVYSYATDTWVRMQSPGSLPSTSCRVI